MEVEEGQEASKRHPEKQVICPNSSEQGGRGLRGLRCSETSTWGYDGRLLPIHQELGKLLRPVFICVCTVLWLWHPAPRLSNQW